MHSYFNRVLIKHSHFSFKNRKPISSLAPKLHVDQNPEIIKLTKDQKSILFENPNQENPYYVENGLRKVYPYNFRHSTYCKGRWINRNLIDVYCSEFALCPREEIERRIKDSSLTVNGQKVDFNYTLKNSDVICSKIHRHELPTLATPINLIYESEEFIVVDKPPSIPVHPCGLFRNNTIVYILNQESKRKDLYVTHRLDRLTSGILIIAKNSKKSREIHENLNLRNINKEYLCRVEGKFPDEIVTCNKPLKKLYSKIGVSVVHEHGKLAITEFKKLSYNGKSSVVLCKPYTGRTHQIRVHLQYLGYPIVNDPLYNSYAFGPEKGKHGKMQKSTDQILIDLSKEHVREWWLDNKNCPNFDVSKLKMSNDLVTSLGYDSLGSELLNGVYMKDPARFSFDENCYYCKNNFKEPLVGNLLMLLHAFKYQGDDWEFTSEAPKWATESWNIL